MAAPIIDCDVHQAFSDPEMVTSRMPVYLRQGFLAQPHNPWPSPIGVMRGDSVPEGGGPPGSSPDLMREQLLEPFGIAHAVLTGQDQVRAGVHVNVDYAIASARAYNDALIETWLAEDERFLGSIIVAPQDPHAAAGEIRRVGEHPRMVQVLMTSATRTPLGQRFYWPIYAAATELGLPVAIHPGSECKGIANGYAPGPPTTYLEWHTNIPQNFMGQLVSLVCEGVFVEHPTLRFVMIEGGLAWIPAVLWRLDKNWKALRATVPWLRRLPSEYVFEHVRFTTQPMEEPPQPEQLLQLLEMVHAERTTLFSSDYPHWDGDSPGQAFTGISDDLLRRILWDNAAELYGIDAPTATP